jgi:ATP-dependent Lhr-like helicase
MKEAEAGDEAGGRSEEALDFWARQLLERYGVVFRDLLAREDAAPAWRELLPLYRRMEARGEVRGGRFITGVGGEQFALPEAVDLLRRAREEGKKGELVVISAVDPLNLVGILTPGYKIAATASNAVAYLDGKYVGHREGGEIWIDPSVESERARRLEQKLKTGRLTD